MLVVAALMAMIPLRAGSVEAQSGAAHFLGRRFETIKSLGSCRGLVELTAEHRGKSDVTLFLRPKKASASFKRLHCNLVINDLASQFSHYTLAAGSTNLPRIVRAITPGRGASIALPHSFLKPGREVRVALSIRDEETKTELGLRAPMIFSPEGKPHCVRILDEARREEGALRRCHRDSDCSVDAIPFGCGCQHDKPARHHADVATFFEIVKMAESLECDLAPITSCVCLPVSEVVCRSGLCDWK